MEIRKKKNKKRHSEALLAWWIDWALKPGVLNLWAIMPQCARLFLVTLPSFPRGYPNLDLAKYGPWNMTCRIGSGGLWRSWCLELQVAPRGCSEDQGGCAWQKPEMISHFLECFEDIPKTGKTRGKWNWAAMGGWGVVGGSGPGGGGICSISMLLILPGPDSPSWNNMDLCQWYLCWRSNISLLLEETFQKKIFRRKQKPKIPHRIQNNLRWCHCIITQGVMLDWAANSWNVGKNAKTIQQYIVLGEQQKTWLSCFPQPLLKWVVCIA